MGAERNFMNAEQPSGAAPGDKAGFPSCAEEQVWRSSAFSTTEAARAEAHALVSHLVEAHQQSPCATANVDSVVEQVDSCRVELHKRGAGGGSEL